MNTMSWKTKLLGTRSLKITKILEMGTKGKQIDHKKNFHNDFVIQGENEARTYQKLLFFLFHVNFMLCFM